MLHKSSKVLLLGDNTVFKLSIIDNVRNYATGTHDTIVPFLRLKDVQNIDEYDGIITIVESLTDIGRALKLIDTVDRMDRWMEVRIITDYKINVSNLPMGVFVYYQSTAKKIAKELLFEGYGSFCKVNYSYYLICRSIASQEMVHKIDLVNSNSAATKMRWAYCHGEYSLELPDTVCPHNNIDLIKKHKIFDEDPEILHHVHTCVYFYQIFGMHLWTPSDFRRKTNHAILNELTMHYLTRTPIDNGSALSEFFDQIHPCENNKYYVLLKQDGNNDWRLMESDEFDEIRNWILSG
jgi:hypothetical protein